MGGSDETVVRNTVKNKINIEIENVTKSLTSVINETSNEVVNEMTQKIAASIKQKTSASNTLAADSLVAVGAGSSVNIEQQAEVEAKNQALIQIMQSGDAMNDLANNMISKFNEKIDQDAAAKASMNTVNALKEKETKGGGPEGLVDSVVGMVKDVTKSLTGGSSSSTTETTIENEVRQKLKQESITENYVKNSVANKIKTSINQDTAATCEFDTNATNTINVKDILAAGGGNINVKQKVSVKAFNDCVVKLDIGAKAVSALVTRYDVLGETDKKQVAKAEGELKSESTISKETIQESAIMSSVDNLVNKVGSIFGNMTLMIGLVVVIAVGGIIYLFASGAITMDDIAGLTPMGKASSLVGDVAEAAVGGDDDDQEGGGLLDRKVYMIAGLVAFLILVARKSIPLCGALLVVIILYFANRSNPSLFNFNS